MRTDVKIGLIAVFVIVLGLVAYFAWQGKKTEVPSPLPTVGAPLATGSDAGTADATPADSGMRLTPPALGSATTAPATMASAWPATGPASRPAWDTGLGTTRPDTTLPRSPWDTASTTRPAWEIAATPPTPPTTRPSWDTRPLTTDTTDTLGTGATTHTVVAGDTFGKLAKQYHTTIKAIAAANPSADSSHLKIGQKLNLPAAAGTTGTDTTIGTRTGTDTVIPPTTTTKPAAVPGGKYTVQKGDTLTKIAVLVYGDKKYAARIARANRTRLHGDPNSIEIGQVLVLPAK